MMSGITSISGSRSRLPFGMSDASHSPGSLPDCDGSSKFDSFSLRSFTNMPCMSGTASSGELVGAVCRLLLLGTSDLAR